MKVSVCVTTFNEEKSIEKLLDSLIDQTQKADEIIIVDGGSNDKTIQKMKSYKKVRLIISKGANIAKGRNISVKNAKNEIIVMTDAGCVCDNDWLKEITKPLEKKEIKVVAGFYEMTGDSDFQKALKLFLGITPQNFDKKTFLPSTRSVAFRKEVWKKVNGFNEKLDRAGEDTEFNIKLIKNKFNIYRAKKAIVYWKIPENLTDASKKFFYYAKGDAQSKQLSKHNIKVLSIFGRYFIFTIIHPMFLIYLFWVIWKFKNIKLNWSSRLWTVIIQLVSDFSVMAGFLNGIF